MDRDAYTAFLNASPEALLKTALDSTSGYHIADGWRHSHIGPAGDWKLHVYADTAEDWAAVTKAIVPYLQINRIYHKTIIDLSALAALTQNPLQKGKSYTLYSPEILRLKQIAVDLDSLLLRMSTARTVDPGIAGDAPLGQSGRLFYRFDKDLQGNYRANDGAYKPAEIEDPFRLFEVESMLARLPDTESIILGREGFGSQYWQGMLPVINILITRSGSGYIIECLDKNSEISLNKAKIDAPTRIKYGDVVSWGAENTLSILRPV